jgi:hypothetical protein
MHLLRRTAVGVVAALALAVPTSAVTVSATAAPGASQSEQAPLAKKKAKKVKVALKRSSAYSHAGQAGVKVTATATKGKKKLKGKVTFLVNGTAATTSKLRKGKASYRMASTTPPGLYTVTAKYKNKKKSTKVRVYSSAISVSATAFTISASADSWDLPGLTGTVQFKDAPATKGYVDIYQNGNVKGGSSSPDYCCMAAVKAGGTFDFSGYSFLGKVQDKGPGTYSYQAFYTDDAGFDDYIYSTPITVTVTP